jgi:hypothetical protein
VASDRVSRTSKKKSWGMQLLLTSRSLVPHKPCVKPKKCHNLAVAKPCTQGLCFRDGRNGAMSYMCMRKQVLKEHMSCGWNM